MAANITQETFLSHSSSSSRGWNYDVFLSFRGEDTRYKFTGHLYSALVDAGINTFIDDNSLRRGEDISTELLQAIQNSRIAVIVFSRNYAASRWCLEELVKIMECRKTSRQSVLPIFYDVNPSDVRKQMGSFGEAFAAHEEHFMADMDKILRWRTALIDAANLSGWDLTSVINGYEAKIIKKIVQEILNHLNNTYLNVAIYPVGIDSRVQVLNSLLCVGLNDVRIVGICAMGGMGKTTIAKAVYNQFFHSFEGKSFLANVREVSKQPDGQVRLQEQLLSDILKIKKINVNNVDRGINAIKERLCNRKVFVVLDDVDELEQLNAIVRKREWFGLGSRIIITTRDQHLLKNIDVDSIYMVKELSEDESLELFSWHAFRRIQPKEGYGPLSKDVIGYCKGLPLALEVLGSFLFDRSAIEWKSALDKLRRIPPNQIRKKLRISFDALEDDKYQAIFLDIACFFIGVDKDYVVKILNGCGFFAEIGISVLIDRCLLKINEYNKFTMHDLLRDMGREVVREQSPDEPGKCSRLWFYDDVLNVLTNHTGRKAVQGLVLKLPALNKVQLSTKAFAKMNKLRLLQLNYVHLNGCYDHISKELRWLCWHGFPLKFIPTSFHVENMVVIDMKYSKLTQVWKEVKFVKMLEVLDLSHSRDLTKTPDFSQLPNLEKLVLKDCTSLVEVHPSIGSLDRLVIVNMRDCTRLRNLPSSICMLKSLKVLILSGCLKIETLPEDVGKMEALVELLADRTAIQQVPISIVQLKNLRNLSLCGCRGLQSSSLASYFWSWVSPLKSSNSTSLLPASLQGLSSLKKLYLNDCNLTDEAIPNDLGSLSSLESLHLEGNSFRSLPPDIFINLTKLHNLTLNYCTRLESLPELPSSLIILNARNCTSLERLSNLSRFQCIPNLCLADCHKLVEIPGLEKFESCGNMYLERCNNLSDTLKKTLLQGWSGGGSRVGNIYFPGNEIPDWFFHQCMGPSLTFQVPPILGRKMKGITLCVVYASGIEDSPFVYVHDIDPEGRLRVTLTDKTKGLCWSYGHFHLPRSTQDLMRVIHLPHLLFSNQLEGGDEVDVVVDTEGKGFIVKRCGVHLAYDQAERIESSDSRGLMVYDSASNENAVEMWSKTERARMRREAREQATASLRGPISY